MKKRQRRRARHLTAGDLQPIIDEIKAYLEEAAPWYDRRYCPWEYDKRLAALKRVKRDLGESLK